jgi:hypothetical protein
MINNLGRGDYASAKLTKAEWMDRKLANRINYY